MMIHAACGDHPHEIELSAGEVDENGAKESILDAFLAILSRLETLDRFQGWEFEHNDNDSGRMSGYDRLPYMLLNQTFDPHDPQISSHRRLAAPPQSCARSLPRPACRLPGSTVSFLPQNATQRQ